MKLKAVITYGAPQAVVDAMTSRKFLLVYMDEVLSALLGVSNPQERPAEYYVQEPDRTINLGSLGVELRLTGVSRAGRKSSQFHRALQTLQTLAKASLQEALDGSGHRVGVQVFTVIMLDGEVETEPGSGKYSNTLESEAEWVRSNVPVRTTID